MTREEAIKVVRNIYQTDVEKEALETLVPELKESEDERIIKTLQEYVKNRNWNLGGPTQDEVLAWLEKQKGKKPVVNLDQFKSLMLQYVQDAANRNDDSEIEEDTDKYAKKLFALAGIQQEEREGDNETEVQKAYREGKNAGRKEVFDHPEYYGLQLRRMYDYETGERNPDWNEEDKQWLSEVYFAIDHSMYSEVERQAMKEYIDFLRSQAKLKQERNEEDEKVRKWLLEYFYLHRDDLRGASVTSMEVLSFLNRYDTEEDIDEQEFNPKPGEKFWVRCKTNKTVNLWFDKDDERPAYAVDADGIITYIVHIKKDGTGNCVSYQNKEKFLETFEIIKKP